MEKLITKLQKIKLSPRVYLDFPDTPGVYIYFKNGYPIYVGKAINLKKRVASYFRLKLETKTAHMMGEAQEISYIKVANELEALLLEAKLIKNYQPKFNIVSKDDKNPLYIEITKEKYPRVITLRKPDLNKIQSISIYGPFPSSISVKSVLKTVRRVFPYSDHKIGKRPCLYSQLGLCNPCPNEIEESANPAIKAAKRTIYLKNIRNLRSLLDGKPNLVKRRLEAEMKAYSDSQSFEQASILRDKIRKLDYIINPRTSTDSYLQNPNLYEDVRGKELGALISILNKFGLEIKKLNRIECYDVAHLQGTSASASMVTFVNGSAEKTYYRHFKIRQQRGQDDYASMREVAKRRKQHLENWGKPDLIVVDGGKGQMSVFLNEFKKEDIPVIGLAKKQETLVIPITTLGANFIKELKMPKGPALNLIQRIRNEAHRFAQAYHHKLFTKSLFES